MCPKAVYRCPNRPASAPDNPNINISKFEPLKPSRSGDQPYSNFEGSCEAGILFGKKYDFHRKNTHTVYI